MKQVIENYQYVAYIIMVTAFTLYIGFLLIRYGVLPSISESFYRLPDKWSKVFSWWAFIVAFGAMMSCNHWAITTAGAGLILVGVYAWYKEKMIKIFHYAGATMAVVGTQIYIVTFLWNSIPHWVVFVTYLIVAFICVYYWVTQPEPADADDYYEDENAGNELWFFEMFFFVTFLILEGVYLFTQYCHICE